MEITFLDFVSELSVYPALIIHDNTDIGSNPCQRVDGCSQRNRHLCLHPCNAAGISDFHGGSVQPAWCGCHDTRKSKGGRNHLQYGRFSMVM